MKLYRSIFHNSSDAVIVTYPSDNRDEIFYANPESEKLFGYTFPELQKISLGTVVDRNDPKLMDFLKKLKEEGTATAELIFLKKDGSKFPGEISANFLIGENNSNMNISYVRDVSWRKNTENILKENKNKFKYQALLLNQVNDAVVGLDKDLKISYWNNGAEKIFGYTETEAMGRYSFELLRPNYSIDERQKILDELEGNGNSKTIITTKTKNGNEIIVEQNSSKIDMESAEVHRYLVVYQDITKRKTAEENLKNNEERYRNIINNIQDGFFRLSADGTIIMASPSLARIYGFNSIHEILGSSAEILYKNIDAFAEILNELQTYGKLENYEVKGTKNDGTTLWISLNAQYIYDDQNQIKGIDGFVRDINLRKSTENALKMSEERYSDILENIQDAYMRADNSGRIIMANRAAAKMYAYDSPSEMIGTNASSYYKNPEERYLVFNILKKYGKIENNELEAIRTDGSIFIASQNAQYFFNDQKEILGIETLVRDVTKNKEAELLNTKLFIKEKMLSNQLKLSNSELQSMAEELKIANLELKLLTEDLKISNQELQLNQKVQRQINKSLSESKELFLKAFHSNPASMTLIDEEGKWIDVNESFMKLTGYSRNELIGNSSSELNLIPKTEDKDLLLKSKNNGRLLNREIEIKTKDGESRVVISSTEPIQVGSLGRYISFIYDITERKSTALKIQKKQKLLKYINRAFHESLAYETSTEVINMFLEISQELTGSEFGFFGEINEQGRLDDRALSPPAWDKCQTPNAMDLLKDMEIVSYWGRTIKEGKSQLVNNPESDPDRKGLPAGHPPINSFLGVPVKQENKTLGMIALANKMGGYSQEDVSDVETIVPVFLEILMRKRAEIKIKDTLKNLERSNKELEQFAYITSHDLREPLRMITSFLQLLQRRYSEKLDKDANEFIGYAVEGAKRLDDMTNDLLQYSKLNSKKRNIKPINYEKPLNDALINLKVPVEENHAVITHDPLPTIEGDEKLMVQLFQNLIGNAIKYRSNKKPEIHISAKKEKKQYLFSVSDNGIGMEENHLKKIFTIFQRLHTQEEYKGTGIGLAISKKIVEIQGGKIWAESEIGKGTTFYFTVPIKQKLIQPHPKLPKPTI